MLSEGLKLSYQVHTISKLSLFFSCVFKLGILKPIHLATQSVFQKTLSKFFFLPY